MKLRIKFIKYGPVRFIGHLDVMRYFQKALRRAEIDVTYTAGFSPHQVMSFAAPLGVGLTSNGEYMDIQVNSLPSTEKVAGDSTSDNSGESSESGDMSPCELLVQRLNAVCVPGLEAVSARILPESAGNAMASVAAASYTVRFREGRELGPTAPGAPADAMGRALAAFLAREEIVITKETKRGVREVNLRPGIYELKWQENAFSLLVDASSAGNIKPVQVISALMADCGEILMENALAVTREDLFTDLGGGEAGPRLVSLGDIGSEWPVKEQPLSAGGVS